MRHEWCIEELRKEGKVRAVSGYGIDEVLSLLHERLYIFVWSHLPLDKSQSHDFLLGGGLFYRLFIVDVVPFQENSEFFGCFIAL